MNCNWNAPHPPLNSRAFLRLVFLLLAAAAACPIARAQDWPYFVTYSDKLQEPGTLEVSLAPAIGFPRAGPHFLASSAQFEYGATEWWTTELYLDGQATSGDSAILTGYRWENRFRPLRGDHWINPVLYLEFEDVNSADKTLKEVVGFDSTEDAGIPNAQARRKREREIETKLILSSSFRGWNFSENFLAGKDLRREPWEFGYSLGVSRALGSVRDARRCSLCRQSLTLGAELYGGLGDWDRFTLSRTAHYFAPAVSWQLPRGVTLRFSPTFGLTDAAHRALLRFAASYEVPSFGRSLARLFHHLAGG